MTNNDILRRIRFILNLNDSQVLEIFKISSMDHTIEDFNSWLLKDEDEGYRSCQDYDFACFLNGLIVWKRGPREGGMPEPETKLTNNIRLKKIKIAFELTNDDIIDCLQLVDLKVSKNELTAFFRKVGHKHYRELKDQFLRNFLLGLQKRLRPIQEKITPVVAPKNDIQEDDPKSKSSFNPWDK